MQISSFSDAAPLPTSLTNDKTQQHANIICNVYAYNSANDELRSAQLQESTVRTSQSTDDFHMVM